MKRFRNLTPLLFIFLTFSLAAQDWASVIEESGPSIAKVNILSQEETLMSQGTGFLVSFPHQEEAEGKTYVITNAHVVREAYYNRDTSIGIEFAYSDQEEKETIPGTIALIDFSLDLAALSLNREDLPVLSLGEKKNPALMSPVLVAGYPLGQNFKATPGFIQAIQDVDSMPSMLDMSAVLAPGNSGGPVLGSRGQVLGIATSTIPGYNFNFAIPVSRLYTFLESQNNKQTVTISANEKGSWIFLDGQYRGETPQTLEIINRKYQLRLEKPGFEIVEESIGPWEDSQRTTSLDFELTEKEETLPSITITTEPEGAEIFINHKSRGISPITITEYPNRILRIRTELNRHKEGSRNYTVTEESEQRVHLELEKRGGWFW